MTRLYHWYFDKPLSMDAFNAMMKGIPVELHDKIRKYKRWQDAHLSLFGKLLLQKGLSDLAGVALKELQCTPYGKLYVEDKGVSFNLSHAGTLVVCIVSTDAKTLGLDVEEIKHIPIEDFKQFWTGTEWDAIQEGGLPAFYKFWTRKEAVIKAEGRGLSIPLNQVDVSSEAVTFDGTTYYLREIPLRPGYIVNIASDVPLAQCEIVDGSWPQL